MHRDLKFFGAATLLILAIAAAATAQAPAPDTPTAEPTTDRAAPKVVDPLIRLPGVEAGIASITAEEFKEQLDWWAHDDRGGREPGMPGSIEAGDVAAREFERLKLEPFGDEMDGRRSYFQYFKSGGRYGFGSTASLVVAGESYAMDTDYVIQGWSAKIDLEDLDTVFAGYGIRSRRLKYNDYEGIDVKGKAVLILADEPQKNDADSRWKGKKSHPDASIRRKASQARRAGAKLLLVTTGPLHGVDGNKLPLNETMRSDKCPVLYIKPAIANKLLASSGHSLESIQTEIDKEDAPASMALQAKVTFRAKRELVAQARNIIARLPGTDPNLKDEALIIGAHYDHLGIGRFGSRARNRLGEIHNGADDNATGAVGVLELAEAFAESGVTTKRSIVFILFDAEEKGLLGARYFVEKPTVPLKKIAGMMNMDMIGRINPKKMTMSVSGVGTCKEWKEICTIAAINSQLKWTQRDGAFGGSDHLPFLQKKIPVLMFNSGIHNDYHTPDDDAARCNPDGAREILRAMFRMAYQGANLDTKPQWVDSRPRRLGLGVRTRSVKGGARIVNIDANTPAQLAGLKLDDVLTKVNGKPVRTGYSIRRALRRVKAGMTVKVEYERGGKKMDPVEVTFPKPKKKAPKKKAAPKRRELR